MTCPSGEDQTILAPSTSITLNTQRREKLRGVSESCRRKRSALAQRSCSRTGLKSGEGMFGLKDKNKKGTGFRRKPAPCRLNGVRLDVVVESEFIRVRPHLYGLNLVLHLVIDPGLDQFFAEDITLEQEIVIFFKGLQ
jgi:hypothetical protein